MAEDATKRSAAVVSYGRGVGPAVPPSVRPMASDYTRTGGVEKFAVLFVHVYRKLHRNEEEYHERED